MFVALVRASRRQYAYNASHQLSGIKNEERERKEERNGVPHANCRKRATEKATRCHGAHTREDPLTFFQYEAQRDEQALRVGLREELSFEMQKYLRVLVKGPFMHV